ncbi:MAG: 2-oxo acid dehydrogenase subunit E2 [Verrucomicrobiae bacterium]|nr:2-oxo acid dehydrogenase subunit E2 [Verrucomicrobiae bacterium]
MDIKLPRLGEGADSGVVVNVLVKEGDTIQAEQPILELETEKAVGTIPSPAAGTVAKIYVKVGDKISAGQPVLALTDGAGTTAPAAQTPIASAPTAAAPARPVIPPAVAPVAPSVMPPAAVPVHRAVPGVPIAASPTVRRLAADLGIDLTRVPGSEPGGRVTLADVRAYIQQLQALAAGQPAAMPVGVAPVAPVPTPESIDFSQWGPIRKVALPPIRQTIARRLHESWTSIPHVTQFDEADGTALMGLLKQHKAAFEKQGVRLTMTPLLMKCVVAVLKKHPVFNASLSLATQELVYKEYYHFGIAVDTEQGLLVPVVRNVDQKSVLDLARELEQLAEKARQRKLTGEEMRGGSFTISNQGSIGSGHYTPIINPPEVAILGIGRGRAKPVARDADRVEVRTMIPLALSYDHRVADGAQAARFMVDLVATIEQVTAATVGL